MHLLYKLWKFILNLIKHYIFISIIAYVFILILAIDTDGISNSIYPNIFIFSYHTLFDSDSVLWFALQCLIGIIYILAILIYKIIKKMRKKGR